MIVPVVVHDMDHPHVEHGQKSVTVSGLKRGLVYRKKFLLRMRSCIRLHTANYGERRKGFEQE